MKAATRAPCYAAMYHALCDTARAHGYTLAIHGTVTTDLDLVAIPWTEEAAPAEIVIEALRRHLAYVETVPAELRTEQATPKPHGRLAWNLYLDHGGKVDVSVMPRKRTPPDPTTCDHAKHGTWQFEGDLLCKRCNATIPDSSNQ